MKYNNFLVLVLLFVFAFSINLTLFAQNDEEYSPEEWQRQMDEATTKKNDVVHQLNLLFEEADSLNKVIAEKEAEFGKELNHLYLWVGSTESGVADYRVSFESTEKSINGKLGSREEQIKKFEEIEASKIKCLPEFWYRYQEMKKKTDQWDNEGGAHKCIKDYCAYKIFRIKQHYGNMPLWLITLIANKADITKAMAGILACGLLK
ncbi:MAG: hypothetical protein ISS16_08705 [Ignavibacteria bacterium]|nr:hypothetical protein [Ignavibacteria bacterium]